jgi:DNA-binding MarR family transcriptional regulator
MSAAPKLALAPAAPSLGEVLDFMRLIWALHHALQQTSKRMKGAIGVTGPQRLVIRIVTRFPGIPAGQIAQFLHVHPSTLTGVLKRLERQGLIHRRPDPKDGRRAFLGITEKGKRIDAAGAGTVEAAVERLLARTSRSKLDGARAVLADLASDLSKAYSPLATRVPSRRTSENR